MATIMVDGIAPDVPAIHAAFPASPVCAYINGEYAWSKAQEHLFARKIRISTQPGQPQAARHARGLDVERYDATPADAPGFLRERAAAVSRRDGTIYCSLATVPAVLAAAGDAGVEVPRWWLAWWWGQPGQPTASQVLAELQRLTGAVIPPQNLWACQYASHAQWDLSAVYGPHDWSR